LKSNFEVLSVPSRCFPGYPDNTPKFISLKPSHFAEGRFHRRDILPKVHFIEDTLHRSEKSILPKSISPKSVLPNGMNFSSKMIKTDLNGINFNKFNPKNFFMAILNTFGKMSIRRNGLRQNGLRWKVLRKNGLVSAK